jgi:hypothetical protein
MNKPLQKGSSKQPNSKARRAQRRAREENAKPHGNQAPVSHPNTWTEIYYANPYSILGPLHTVNHLFSEAWTAIDALRAHAWTGFFKAHGNATQSTDPSRFNYFKAGEEGAPHPNQTPNTSEHYEVAYKIMLEARKQEQPPPDDLEEFQRLSSIRKAVRALRRPESLKTTEKTDLDRLLYKLNIITLFKNNFPWKKPNPITDGTLTEGMWANTPTRNITTWFSAYTELLKAQPQHDINDQEPPEHPFHFDFIEEAN